MAIIVICIFIIIMENSFYQLCLGFLLFISSIAGGIYAVGKALGETSKFKNKVDKEEINETND